MAEHQDIPQLNQEQKVILQGTSYLRAFISRPPEIGANWLDELQPVAEPLEREIAQKLGNEWWTTTLVPLALMTREQDIFDKKIGLYDNNKRRSHDQILLEVVKSLFLIGYEVGHINASKFNYQIFKNLSESALFHNPIPENQKKDYTEKSFNCVLGIIRAGSFIRFYTDQSKTGSDLPTGTPPQTSPFEDFIQDLESIDKLPPKDGSI